MASSAANAVDHSKDTLAARKAGMPKTTGSLEPIPGRCAAKLSYTGTGPDNPAKYCKRRPLKSYRRCKLHGGRMQESPSLKLPTPAKLAEDYERHLQDDQLLSLRKEIAWSRAYWTQIQDECAAGIVATPRLLAVIERLLTAWTRFLQASRDGASKAERRAASAHLTKAFEALQAERSPAQIEAGTRRELRETAMTLGYLVDRENKQLERLYNMITTERAMALRIAEQQAVLKAIETHVPDPEVQKAIRRDIAWRFEQFARRRNDSPMVAAGRPAEGGAAADPQADDRRRTEGLPQADA